MASRNPPRPCSTAFQSVCGYGPCAEREPVMLLSHFIIAKFDRHSHKAGFNFLVSIFLLFFFFLQARTTRSPHARWLGFFVFAELSGLCLFCVGGRGGGIRCYMTSALSCLTHQCFLLVFMAQTIRPVPSAFR